MNERQTIDRGWYYVLEPDDGRWAPSDKAIKADDGTVLTRRLHGFPARVEAVDRTGTSLPVVSLLRAAGAVGRALEAPRHRECEAIVELHPAGTATAVDTAPDGRLRVCIDGEAMHACPSHHPVEAELAALLADAHVTRATPPDPAGLPAAPAPRALFFESLMNTDMPHNDKEISQGVLHIVSPLMELQTEVVLVNAKMSITGDDRGVQGLPNLETALAEGPIHLVGITVLEGYWEGVVKLIETIRALGCRAHIAVGGVMPSLAPEHTAAHLPEVSFICRGAGEGFTPALAKIVGTTTVDEPFTAAQRHALLALDGMITVERATGRLLAGRCDRTIQVADLDRVPLDLQHLHARHIEGGIEISTSRGCIHKCSFCSILGRESYQARSAGSVFEVLDTYQRRFEELFGPEHIPSNSYRVHFSDDDFACDKDRARQVFEQILQTPFRLSSVQVAIGDLCKREGGKLLAEPDTELLDAMKPECFADHGRPIPKVDFYEDHKSRNWSSFLQIGVETYSDPEIARLGKGYKLVHVRTIVAELARRGLHMDGYFILSNADTTAEDLVDVFSEVARLKLRFPEHFHMRFPVVQHLVSYFTAASHRRHVRKGRRHVMKLRGHAQVPGHAELDYPFVDHDEPLDAWVRTAVDHTFVTDDGMYTENLRVLAAIWKPHFKQLEPTDPERTRLARILRKLDDRPRRLVFEMLRQAWLGDDEGWPEARLDKTLCLQTAERVLGPQEGWMHILRHVVSADPERRLVVDDAGLADAARSETVDLLLSSDQRAVALQLQGAAGTLDADRVQGWVDALRASDRNRVRSGEVRVLLDGDALAPGLALAAQPVEVQWMRGPGQAPPDAARVRALEAEGVPTRAVLLLRPDALEGLHDQVTALLATGVGELVLEPEGTWDATSSAALGRSLFALKAALVAADVPFAALLPGRQRSGRHTDLALTADGTLTRADLLAEGGGRASRLARLDDLTNIDRHFLELAEAGSLRRAASLDQLHKRTAPALKVLRSFVSWLREQGDAGVTTHARA